MLDGNDKLLFLNSRANNTPAITNHYELIESTHIFANPFANYAFTILLNSDKQVTSYILTKGKCDY